MYASFDDGATWQSLQANLPVSPVYDLVIKDTDLVVATHGRSFWILDDVTQLHQLSELGDDLNGSDAHLLQPRDAVRAPPNLFADFFGSPGGKSYHVSLGQFATFYLEEPDTGHKVKRIIDAGEDLERGVRVTYFLKDAPDDGATLTVLDSDGDEIETFSSDIPAEKEDRDGLYITAHAGMNSFQWPMRHAAGAKMIDTDFHKRPPGPLARPGNYSVKLTVGDWSMTQGFSLVKDPRVTTSDADLAEQFDLLVQIRNKLSDIVNGVNKIRELKKQLASWRKRLDGSDGASDVIPAAESLAEKLDAVEGELVQVEFTTPGDSLNYREMLFEKLDSLPSVVGSADTPPTKQSYEVFDKLAGQADEQLTELESLCDNELSQLNEQLAGLDVGIVGA